MGKDIKCLINSFKSGTLNADELAELRLFLKREDSTQTFAELFDEIPDEEYSAVNEYKTSEEAFQKLLKDPRVYQERLLLRSRPIKKLLYAASVFSAACLALFLLWNVLHLDGNKNIKTHKSAEIGAQVLPGGPKAKILLANGVQIDLESLKNDTLVQMQGYAIHKTKTGLIKYIPVKRNTTSEIYNTIVTPAGGEYQLELADGTHVRINASSELKYPIAFNGTERNVELKGEAYFEVAKSVKNGIRIPFIVRTGQQKIEVLGTSFNVNSYYKQIRTTLVEGSIRLHYKNMKGSLLLKPNEQATYDPGADQMDVETVDPFYTLAWKNGAFAFEKAPITLVMQEIARWYDVSIAYEGDLSGVYFTGSISKYEDISKLLNIICITGSAKFKMEGRRITVMR